MKATSRLEVRMRPEVKARTRVAPAFFDELVAALDAPARPNAALAAAAARAASSVERE